MTPCIYEGISYTREKEININYKGIILPHTFYVCNN